MRSRAWLLLAVLACSVALAGCGGPKRGIVPQPCDEPPQVEAPDEEPRLFADAGEDMDVEVGDRVRLNGSASFHRDGHKLAYHWAQVAGPCVTLDLRDPVHPTFRAPPVNGTGDVLVFRLVVESRGQWSAPDQADITVGRILPEAAQASEASTAPVASVASLTT